MKHLIRIDPKSIKKNDINDAMVLYGKKNVSRTVRSIKVIDGNYYGYTEKFIATGLTADNKLINPVMVRRVIVPYGIQEGIETTITQDAQYVHAVEPPPKFSYEYLPTTVQCQECKEEFLHTELREDYNDWDYQIGCPSEFCNTICPKCNKWWCCEVDWEVLSDGELEKRMGQGINQVVIE